MRYGKAAAAKYGQSLCQSDRKPAQIDLKSFEASENPCASIDAELRDWDVLLGFRTLSSQQIAYKARSVTLWLENQVGGSRGKFVGEPVGQPVIRRVILVSVALCFLLSLATQAQTPKPVETIPIEQIHAGMRGVAYTVFQGTKPEPMDVEVLGVLKNANGPKGDVILVRLGGAKAEYTGVVAGMSGSPVYSERQAGRCARLPHRRILERTDRRRHSHRRDARNQRARSKPVFCANRSHLRCPFSEQDGEPGRCKRSFTESVNHDFTNYLKPIETPLVFNGFSEDTVQRFAPNSPPPESCR